MVDFPVIRRSGPVGAPRALAVGLCIRNSRGEDFGKFWARMKATGKLPSTLKDPRTWAVDPEEKKISVKLRAMELSELERYFTRLITGKTPVIESARHFSRDAFPLTAFIDSLDDPAQLEHQIRSAEGMVRFVRGTLFRDAKYRVHLRMAYERKAFMRELITRWAAA